jgi:pyruvate formate lyase activating enzyme
MTETGQTARIFDIQRFSIHDGPGIRTTVFFKGCPLRCAWCQNPESWSAEPQLMLYPDRCIGCGACAEVCPEAVEGAPPGRPGTCRDCGACADVCPTQARRLAGSELPLEEIARQALRDRPFYGEEGGVTLGGGEPLAQWEAAFSLAGRIRAKGVHVALDTSCTAQASVLSAVPSHFDLVLADLKAVSDGLHARWTGRGNAETLVALRLWAAAMPGRLWVSIPVIPGVQDEAELGRIAGFAASLEPTPPVRVLPCHRLGESKYRALGVAPPAFGSGDGLADAARDILASAGLELLEQ